MVMLDNLVDYHRKWDGAQVGGLDRHSLNTLREQCKLH